MHTELPPPTFVDDEAALSRLLERLERAREIAVDTEGDSFFSYPEKVCLVQLTVSGEDWLVDPLSGIDISALGRVLADPDKLKVFHDGEYDIASLKRDHGFAFKNLFDTRIAAAALSAPSPGLASVLLEHFGIRLDKSMQRSEWSRRPLSEKQIRYAQLDTHFLVQLMHEQRPQLAARNRLMIVEGECRRLERLEPAMAEFDPDEFARIKGARELGPDERQTLRELFVLREKMALDLGRPPFKVVGNEALLAIAAAQPRTLFQLRRINGFSHGQVRKLGRDVLSAVQRAAELGPIKKLPRLPNREGTTGFSEEEVELHERLKQWRKSRALKMGIDSAYLVNRRILLRLARQRPETPEALSRIEGVEPWQIEEFGGEVLAVVRTFEEDLRAGRIQFRRRFGKERVD